MPDQPKIVLAIVNYAPDRDVLIARGMSEFKEALLTFLPLCVFDRPFTVFLYGFEEDSAANTVRLFDALAKLPMDEAAIYVGGEARLHLAPVIARARGQDPG